MALIQFSFFLSGFAALSFQLLWIRLITLFFGHTTLAVATVTAVFMAGLAAGSAASSSLAGRFGRGRLLRTFCLLEAGIALYGLLSLPLIRTVHDALVHTGAAGIQSPSRYALWAAVSFALLIVPTFLMGATLPVLSEWVARRGTSTGEAVSRLYGWNSLGALAGTGVCGLVLTPWVGVSGSILIASSVDLLAVLCALLAGRTGAGAAEEDGGAVPSGPRLALSDFHPSPLVALFVSGFAGMIAEIVWTRTFGSVLGSSVYTFTLVLMAFLLSLGAGGLALKRIPPRYRTLRGLGTVQFLTAGALLLVYPLFGLAPYGLTRLPPQVFASAPLLYATSFLGCLGFIALPGFFMGMSFPWAAAVAGKTGTGTGRSAGVCFAFNTAGSIAGAFAGGFLWLPLLGAGPSMLAGAAVYAAAGILLWHSAGALAGRRLAVPALLAAAVLLMPKWDPAAMASGTFLYGRSYHDVKGYGEFMKRVREDTLLFYRDGLSASIAVFKNGEGEKYLRTNGKTDASTGNDMSTQLLVGYIPLFLHQGTPQRALVVGLGSGATVSALTSARSLARIDCVEIEPAVREAAEFFSLENRFALRDPRVSVLFADARNYLAGTGADYDLIVSEPSNPWIAGVASLYTRESFELGRRRLAKDGVFCQWLHSYSMDEGDFRRILATFSSVYPHVMLFNTGGLDFALVGSGSPLKVDLPGIERLIGENSSIGRDMQALGFANALAFVAQTYVIDDREIRAYAKGSPLCRDDIPSLEFSAPRYLYAADPEKIARGLAGVKKEVLPAGFSAPGIDDAQWVELYNIMGEGFLNSRDMVRAEACFTEALRRDPRNVRTLVNAGRVEHLRNRPLQAEKLFLDALRIDGSCVPACFHLGMLYTLQGMDGRGIGWLEKGLLLSPGDPAGSLFAARAYRRQNNTARARELLTKALAAGRGDPSLRKALETELQRLEAGQASAR